MNSKQKVFEKIIPAANSKVAVLQNIQHSTFPLVIYGIGGYAKSVFNFLEQYQVSKIKINAACVDREYFNPLNDNWNGIPVYPIDELSLNLNSFNVVIGFSDFKLAEKKLETINECKKTFFFDSTLSLDFFDYEYVKKYWKSFYDTYLLLEDELSKDTFIAYINAKISGRSDDLYNLFDSDQYFPEDIIKLNNNNEVFIDAGAYNGDTVLKFIDKAGGHYKAIYAFEPDAISYKKLSDVIKNNRLENVFIFKKGVWKENTVLKFYADPYKGERSLFSENGNIAIEVEEIDNILQENFATFIKMDIEGSELAALQGAEQTIKHLKPKLAICMYHKPEDLITIPHFLKNLVPEYKFFLRNHLHIAQELVLYAI